LLKATTRAHTQLKSRDIGYWPIGQNPGKGFLLALDLSKGFGAITVEEIPVWKSELPDFNETT
jgi:hypothetical protein